MKIKKPITYSNNSKSKEKLNHKLISKYHSLLKDLEKAKKWNQMELIHKLQTELNEIGLPTYQKPSMKGAQHGKANTKWIYTIIQSVFHDLPSISLLDVGALDGEAFKKHASRIQTTRIDLNPQSLHVQKQDFFERPLPESDQDKFHVLSLSLVLNFVPLPEKRLEMLKRCKLFLFDGGILYITLPLPCISNSRYLNHELFTELLNGIGFELIQHHTSLKLAYYSLKYVCKESNDTFIMKKKMIREGKSRNNFAICSA